MIIHKYADFVTNFFLFKEKASGGKNHDGLTIKEDENVRRE